MLRLRAGPVLLALAVLLSGCVVVWTGGLTTTSGGLGAAPGSRPEDLADVQRDLQSVLRSLEAGAPDTELRRIASNPLPPARGLALDLALLTRALAQGLLDDRDGLRRTRDEALRRGRDRDLVLAVLGTHARALRTAALNVAARGAYAEAEAFLVETARREGRPTYRNTLAPGFLQDYLFAAQQLGDEALGESIIRRHLEPQVRDGTVPEPLRRLTSLYIDDFRVGIRAGWGAGDPLEAHRVLLAAVAAHEASVARTDGPLGRSLRVKLLDLRAKAGFMALRAGRPSLALVQLAELERAVAAGETRIAYAADELRLAAVASHDDPDAGLAALDELARRTPLASRFAVIRLATSLGKANLLAGSGRWQEAEAELAAIRIDPARLAHVDLHTGLRSVVRAVLARDDPDLGAFLALEPLYRDGARGVDRSVLYFAGLTVVLQLQGQRGAAPEVSARAVASGRQLGRWLRRQQAAGVPEQAAVSPRFLRTAKEAYAKAALHAQGVDGVGIDDLLDAVQLLQDGGIDRDIAAAALRQRAIPGVRAADLRRLQDLRVRAASTQAELGVSLLTADRDAVELQRRIDAANRAGDELDRTLTSLVREAPGLRDVLGGVAAPTLRELQARLGRGEALRIVVPMTASTLVLAVTRGSVVHHLVPVGRDEVARLVGRVRRSTALSDFARPAAFDADAAHALYRALFGWQRHGLRGIETLTMAASGPLAALPFGLLLTAPATNSSSGDHRRRPWLVRSVAVSQVPSPSAWLSLRADEARAPRRGFIAWADPTFGAGPAPALEPLPDTRHEAHAMARTLGASIDDDVLLGPAATRRSVLERSASGDLARRGVVLFATHGFLPSQGDGLDQPGLAMAHDPAAPDASMLTLDDVMGLRLAADWVILSACNTAGADRAGGDPLSGLSRGFFFAGARGLLVTHWKVESASAAELTTRTVAAHAASPALGRAQALRRASLDLIEARDTPPEWSHPAFWAPFTLVGDGGRRGSAP